MHLVLILETGLSTLLKIGFAFQNYGYALILQKKLLKIIVKKYILKKIYILEHKSNNRCKILISLELAYICKKRNQASGDCHKLYGRLMKLWNLREHCDLAYLPQPPFQKIRIDSS